MNQERKEQDQGKTGQNDADLNSQVLPLSRKM